MTVNVMRTNVALQIELSLREIADLMRSRPGTHGILAARVVQEAERLKTLRAELDSQ